MSNTVETREYPGGAPSDETTVFAEVLDNGMVRFVTCQKGVGVVPSGTVATLGYPVLEQLAALARAAEVKP